MKAVRSDRWMAVKKADSLVERKAERKVSSTADMKAEMMAERRAA